MLHENSDSSGRGAESKAGPVEFLPRVSPYRLQPTLCRAAAPPTLAAAPAGCGWGGETKPEEQMILI